MLQTLLYPMLAPTKCMYVIFLSSYVDETYFSNFMFSETCIVIYI